MDIIIIQILLFSLGCFVLGIIGMAIGDLGKKRNGKVGFLLGALLGPVGWIIVAILPAAAEKEEAANASRSHREKGPVDPTKLILGGLGICSLILVVLLVFAHFVTKF